MIKNQLSAMPTIWYGTNLNDFTTVGNNKVEEPVPVTENEQQSPKPGDLFIYITGDNTTPVESDN